MCARSAEAWLKQQANARARVACQLSAASDGSPHSAGQAHHSCFAVADGAAGRPGRKSQAGASVAHEGTDEDSMKVRMEAVRERTSA